MAGATWATSTAPMSHLAPLGRAMSRWSLSPAAHKVTAVPVTASLRPVAVDAGMRSSAGLAGPGSIVLVSPPLSASSPSRGAAATSFLAGVKPQLLSPASLRLRPPSVSAAEHSGPELPDTIEPAIATGGELVKNEPEAVPVAVLPVIVLLVIVAGC